MATRKEQEILQGNLRKWFNNLGYRVTDTEVKVVTKNSRNAEYWKLIQKLILPGDDIKMIRSKIACYQRKQDYNTMKHEKEMLVHNREKLMAKISASKSRSLQSLADINAIKNKIKTDANIKTDTLQRVSTNTMTGILQKSLAKHCNDVQAKFSENCKSLDLSTSQRCHLSGNCDDAPVIGSKGGIETPCSRDIRAVLTQIRGYLGAHISDSSQDPALKSCVWDSASKLYNQFSPEEIISTIKTISAEQTNSLMSQTETHSIDKDLATLNFGLVEGNIVNKVEHNDPERDLDAHAIVLQNKVSREFIKMLENKNRAKELATTVKILQTELEETIRMLPWSNNEKASLSALLKFKLREKELGSKEFTVKSEIDRLQEEKDLATKEKVQTFKTHRSIMDFKKNQEKKQEMIKSLVGQTGSLKNALDAQTTAVNQFILEKMVPMKDLFSSKLSAVNDYPHVLASTLAKLPLDRLYLSPIPSGPCPVSDLSIYQFEKSINYHKLISSTSLPLHLDSESFLHYISRIICKIDSELLTTAILNNILKCRETDVPNSADIFETLREALYDFDSFTSENILEKIKKSEGKVHSSMNKCSSIKRMITTFTEQPAQHLASWVLVDDLSLKEVQEKWLVKSSI